MISETESHNAATKFSKAKLASNIANQPLTKKFSAAGRPAGITSTMLGTNVYNPQTTTIPFSMPQFPSKMHELDNDDRSSSISDTDDGYLQLKGDKLGVKPAPGKKTRGRVKIHMEYIQNKLRRYTTFSKRKSGIMKKAYELSTLTGTQVMLLVASETGHVYTFATPKLQPMITSETGKALIQTCLHQPDPPNQVQMPNNEYDMRMSANGYEETELGYQIPDEDFKGNIHDHCLIPVSSSNGGIPVMTVPHGMIPMQGFASLPPEMPVMSHSQMVHHQSTQVMSPQHSSPPPSYSPPGQPSSPHRGNTYAASSYPGSPPSTTPFSQSAHIPHHQQVMLEEISYDQRSPSQSPIQHRFPSHSPPQGAGGLYSHSNGSPSLGRM